MKLPFQCQYLLKPTAAGCVSFFMGAASGSPSVRRPRSDLRWERRSAAELAKDSGQGGRDLLSRIKAVIRFRSKRRRSTAPQRIRRSDREISVQSQLGADGELLNYVADNRFQRSTPTIPNSARNWLEFFLSAGWGDDTKLVGGSKVGKILRAGSKRTVRSGVRILFRTFFSEHTLHVNPKPRSPV